MLVYGAGGHGRVVIDALLSCGTRVAGVFDDAVEAGTTFLGFPLFGRYNAEEMASESLVVAIGDNKTRQRLQAAAKHLPGSVVAGSATVADDVLVSLGAVVLQGAVVQAQASVGDGAIVNSGAVVDHGCAVGSFAHVGPGATLCGDVMVGEGALVGAGAVVLPGLTIGAWSVVGAGAVVTETVLPGTTVVGNPARAVS